MNLLERKYFWFWLILAFTTGGASSIALAALTNSFDEKAWYMNHKYWLLGLICLIYPFFIMASIFNIQISCQVAAKLDVPGKELYLSPYIWLLCVIIPVLGWIMLIVMILYIEIWTIVALYRGNGEKYIKTVV